MNVDEILSRLQKVRRSAPGEWTACCPAHEDRSPSLAVKSVDDGRILLHCFAGCSVEEICGALGIALTDLFPDKPLRNDSYTPLPFRPLTMLRALAFHIQTVAIAAADLSKGVALSDPDKDRMFEIAEEFNDAVRLVTR